MFSRLANRSCVQLAQPYARFMCAKPVLVSTHVNVTKHEGKERDLVNYPRIPPVIESGKVRLAIVPEEFFDFLYKKIGVSGPYTLLGGFATFLISKEYVIWEHELANSISFVILVTFLIKKFGPGTAKFLDEGVKEDTKQFNSLRDSRITFCQTQNAMEKDTQWRAEGQATVYDAKKENVQLQLETAYRKNLMLVHSQVKRRLDYHVEILNVKTRLEQKHMVDWIVNSVRTSISKAQEDAAMKKCFSDLSLLAKTA